MGPLTILMTLCLALCACGLVLGFRLQRCNAANRGVTKSLSIIIPARNEAHNLPVLLKSIQSQTVQPTEVLVIDDCSSDGTAEAARKHGAKVLTSGALQEGWRGKTWACHQGATVATGELLLFLDADTWFEPGGLSLLLSCYNGGALSVGPYHATKNLYEELSLFFNLNMNFGTVPNGLFGQTLLIDRQGYARVGGHTGVKNRILENFWLAQILQSTGISTHSVCGRGLLTFRMYPNGLSELVRGWIKGFASGAGHTDRGTLILCVAWLTGLTLAPIGWLVSGSFSPWFLVYMLCAAQVLWCARQIGGFRLLTALLYPVPIIFFFIIFFWSSVRSGKRVEWKGREINAD